jgi:hypothetical protein
MRHASVRSRRGARAIIGAVSKVSNAAVASFSEISRRHQSSWSTEDTSDQSSAGATSSSPPNKPNPSAARQAWTAALPSTTYRAQRASRDRRMARMTSGIGSPVALLRHLGGNDAAETATQAMRSDSSIRCCVPTRRERRRPERIHRRTVSGLQPARRAASETVNMCSILHHTADFPLAWPPGATMGPPYTASSTHTRLGLSETRSRPSPLN